MSDERRATAGSSKASRAARRRADSEPHRDQAHSTFTEILTNLVRTTPGAMAAALVDSEGETVDYAGWMEPFDLKVAAAHWQIELRTAREEPKLATVRQLVVRARQRSYVVRQIHAFYTLVVVMHRWAGFAVSERALQQAESLLCDEAGLVPLSDARWFAVDVETQPGDPRRPIRLRVADTWQPVEVMGCLVGMHGREKGFRVRLPKGAELMLVRERHGRWFADDHVDGDPGVSGRRAP